MDEQDPITGTTDSNDPPAEQPEGEGVPIPSRIRAVVDDVRERIQEERDVVKEYEERYHGRRRLETPPVSDESGASEQVYVQPPKSKRIYDPVSVSENERKWAAIAHGSSLLTALLGILSGGALVLL